MPENMHPAYTAPSPILDSKESKAIDTLAAKYEKMTKPNAITKAGKKVSEIVPAQAKDLAKDLGDTIADMDIYTEVLKVAAAGFGALQENAAKYTLGEKDILKRARAHSKIDSLKSIDELCLARSYELAKIVDNRKLTNLAAACAEGMATGIPGFAGVPFNLALSTFLYFRAVQFVAMCYGYDVKNNPDELAYASEVFMAAMSPRSEKVTGAGTLMGKVMFISELEAVKTASKKTWTEMASRGGVALLLTQMRALANKSAERALQNAGAKALEQSVFTNVLEQIGKRLTLTGIRDMVPVVSGVVGALFDTGMMSKVITFANVFYQKRFIMEKEDRIAALIENRPMDDETELREILAEMEANDSDAIDEVVADVIDAE